jgi:hypothetical protein
VACCDFADLRALGIKLGRVVTRSTHVQASLPPHLAAVMATAAPEQWRTEHGVTRETWTTLGLSTPSDVARATGWSVDSVKKTFYSQ